MKHVWLWALLAVFATSASAQELRNASGGGSASAALGSTAASIEGDASSSLWDLHVASYSAERLVSARGTSDAFGALAEPEPVPASPEPKFVYGARDDYRWQLALGISVVRFRSSRFYATGVGTSTSVTYFTNEWFGVEGGVHTAFAPTIYQDDHVKYVSYGGGPKIAWRQRKWEPWMHGIIGGVHVAPQTAGTGKNAFAMQIGGGADYRFYPHLSARLELDWVRSHLFSQWQDSVQTALDIVLHF